MSKLVGLNADLIEDALGIACTQACGLMSAQFESEISGCNMVLRRRTDRWVLCLREAGMLESRGFLSEIMVGS